MTTIQVKRGLKANINNVTLSVGELAYTTDTHELYAGSSSGNQLIASLNWSSLLGKPTLATVATSGSYNDLLNKPTIPTSLLGLSDVDVTNKTNGYTLQYDSAVGKYVSKALPSGSGSGATSMSGLSDVDVTSISPAEGNVLTYTSGKWKPEVPVGPSAVANIYVVELSRWGIKQGLPAKTGTPAAYQTSDYTNAYNNVVGFNNAFSWASSNNYDYVVIPAGSYAMCYSSIAINPQGNTTYDFTNVTIKVIYDSDIRQPYDAGTGNTYAFAGYAMVCSHPNTHILGLTLIGDRADRSWTQAGEAGVESSYGLQFGGNASNSSAKYCNVSYFMGDCIYISFAPYTSFGIGGMEAGALDSNGNTTTSTTGLTVRSNSFINLPSGIKSMAMIGLGYAPTTNIPNGSQYNVYFYDSTGKFLYKKLNVRTRDTVQIGRNATKIKLSWEGFINSATGTVSLDGGASPNPPYWGLLINGGIPNNVEISYCEIHGCQRGGMFLGGSNCNIFRNYFHDTGQDTGNDIDGYPPFTDFTRYCIDCEDNVGQNNRIMDNIFENARMGISMRGNYIEISGNEFRNVGIGIEMYIQTHANITRNFFYYSSCANFNYYNADRNWLINDNVFVASSLSMSGTGTVASANNNRFYQGSNAATTMKILSFKGNVFNGSTFTVNENNTIIDGCSFVNASSISAVGTTNYNNNIIRCYFAGGSYVLGQTLTQGITIKDSILNEAYFYYKNGNIPDMVFKLVNCTVNNVAYPVLYNSAPSGIGVVDYTLDLENCTVSLGVTASKWTASKSYNVGVNGNKGDLVIPTVSNGFYYECTTAGRSGSTEPNWSTAVTEWATVTDGGVTWTAHPFNTALMKAYKWGSLIINNSNITFNLPYTYSNKLFESTYGWLQEAVKITSSTLTATPSSATADMSYTKSIFVSADTVLNNILFVNTNVPTLSDKMPLPPTAGTYSLGQVVYNTTPTPGGYLGWVCTTAGRMETTQWQASYSYLPGAIINVGSYCYQTNGGGNSFTTQPSFPTGSGATVYETPASITIWQPNTSYTAGQYVYPATYNNSLTVDYVLQARSSGISGGTEPNWVNYTYNNDGQTAWNVIRRTLWTQVGPLGTMKPFGLISS